MFTILKIYIYFPYAIIDEHNINKTFLDSPPWLQKAPIIPTGTNLEMNLLYEQITSRTIGWIFLKTAIKWRL